MPDAIGLFDPDRVAVVGGTDSEGSIGRAIMENLESFDGTVLPVNPKKEEVLGHTAVSSVEEIQDPIDLAVVVVPPKIAIDATRELGAQGVTNVVVITAGFGEAGSEGATREQELSKIADEYEMNLVGPNSLGVMSTPDNLNATFGPSNAIPGGLSFMSQSGAFITAVVDWAIDQGIGFNDIVSLGNKAVLDESDFIEIWESDPNTEVILGYLEGIDDGRAFIDNARSVTKETPIILVKSGRTEAGAQAASSHTGTIAGSERAYEAGLDQAGVLRAENVQELFDYAQILEGQPVPDGDGIAVICNAGGPGVMATDAIGESNYDMASFQDETLETLQDTLPEGANIYNPVDVIGDADNERFKAAIDIVLSDKNVQAAMVLASPIAVLDYETLAIDISTLQEKYETPVATALMGGERIQNPADTLREHGIPNYFDPARAVNSLDALMTYRDNTQIEYETPEPFDVDKEKVQEILETATKRSNRLGVEAMGILDAYGIETPTSEIVDSPQDARAVAAEITGDVVMKIVSPDILHKSDIGGVKVGVPESGVKDAYEDLLTRAKNYQPDARILGVQLQEMVDLDTGIETILGMNRDPQFGPLLLFGLGGIFVEILEDTTVRVAPISEREAKTMIGEIDSAPLLRGARGNDPVDETALVEAMQRLSLLVTDFPAILELDINPLVVSPDGVQAVDSRLTVDPDKL
ncbi:MAG: acetate--CoA ligase family protein [Halodesulfurarchaeum sp.]|nr:acetate--CoA ligase family protein [Halodesulfurarchaeum sp.]